MKRALVIASLASLVAAPAAHASVTIGSDLGRPINVELDCGASSCTLVQTDLPSASQAAGGVSSPVNGVITAWRIRAGSITTTTSLKVSRPLEAGLATGAGTSNGVMPPSGSISTHSTSLPIAIGDQIGIQCPGAPIRYFVDGGGTMASYQPILTDGGPARVPDTTAAREIAINADIEPTATFTINRVKPKRGGAVRVDLELPNPGSLAAANATKRKLLKRRSAGMIPGPLSLVVKPTKAAKSALADGRRPKAKLKLVFTPTGGGPFTQVVPMKLKR